MNKDQKFILQDLLTHGQMFGWDWEADYRFAVHLGRTEVAELMLENINSSGLLAFRIAAYKSDEWQKVYRKRLRVLRDLVDLFYVRDRWVGMPASVTDGSTRTKEWSLTNYGRDMAKRLKGQDGS